MAIIIAVLSFTSQATVYYVSSSGNDSNPGTSEGSAWRSLEKVNSVSFKAGDHILFKRGESWVGTIKPSAPGTAGSPIVYGAYGSGDKPKIYNSKVVSGWQLHSGKIYKTAVSADKIEQLFIDETRINSARHPNSGYLKITAVNSSVVFTSTQISSNINYSGATAVIRDKEWSISSVPVTGSSAQTLTLASAPLYGLGVNKGFVLVNKLEFLDKAGEWYYDTKAGVLYLWTPQGDSPANHTVRVSVADYTVQIENKSYITIRDLALLHSNSDAVYINGSSYITIDNNTILFPDNKGIMVNGSLSGHISIVNNNIDGANHDGIKTSGTYHEISGNTIKNIRLFENFGVGGLGEPMGGRGINVNGKNCTIRYNHIENVGYNGISFFTAPYTIIEYNYIKNACLTIQDGGGIYCYNTSETDPGCEYSEIRGNIIDNVPGNIEGCITSLKQGCGIYMDDRIHHIVIENNTVTRSSYYAIYLHNNKNVIARNNTLFDNGSGYRATGSFGATQNSFKNNIVLNIATSGNGSQATLGLLNSGENSIVDINSNRYIDKHRQRPFANTKDYTYKSFTEWKSVTGKDNNSTFDGTPLATGETEVLLYNNNKQVKTINLGTTIYRDIDGKQVSGNISLQPFTSIILIKTSSSGSSNQTPVIQGQNFQINSDAPTGTFVGQVVASDPDQGQLLSYAISGGNNEGLFYIEPETGKIYTKTSIATTQDKSVNLIVTVTDNATTPLSASATVTVNITASIISQPADISSPVVSSFSVSQTSTSLTIPVITFNASDNTAVTGYLITESATPPSAEDNGWLSSAPASYTVSSEGTFTLYAWAKDAQGNVSTAISASVTVVLQVTNLFSEYLFEEASGTIVIDSKGSNNGNIINAESRCEGVNGKGLTLTGENYINLGKTFCDIQDKLTLSAWVKPDINSLGYQGIIMKGGPADDTYAIYIYQNTKQIAFKASGTSSPWLPVNNMDILWDGNWHNITATYDGNQMIIYLDNVVIAKTNSTGNITSGAGYNLLVGAGRDTNPPSLFYKGEIDEVRIYNYALSAEEVSQLYNSVVNVTTEPVYATEEVSICQGENYLGWNETGTYERTLTASSGVDSIVTTTLTVNLTYLITEEITINEGENYLDWTQTGQYERVLTSSTGCDSIIITNLVVQQNISLFSEYLFEEASGTIVFDSKGSNNGNIINTESRCEGVNGKGLTLTGSNYINLGICFCDVQNTITLSAWIKPDINSSGYQGIIMKGGPVDDTYALYINPGTKQIAFKASGTSSPWLTVNNMDKLWDGNWHNITATYDGKEMIIYLDNVVIAKTNSTGNITSGAGYNLLVGAGRDTNPPSLFYKGEIDEVRIYNYALSVDEVSQLFNSTVNNKPVPVYATEKVNICQGENYLGWNETGTYQRILTASSGADSIVTTELTVNPTYLITEEITINEGENYLGWTQSGQYERVLTSATGCDSIITTNLVVQQNTSLFSEYLFEENSGTIVFDSKGSNNGNIINTESRCEGVKGKGLTLTGSNYINLGICFCDVQNTITLSAWIKPDINSSGYQGIIMKGGSVDDTYALYINPGTKQIAFKTSGTSSPWMTVSNMDKLWDGNWHNVTATYDGKEMIIYLDNVLIAKTNSTGNITSGAGYNLLVGAGRDTNPPSLFYKGEIDEVRIYNYALSVDEVSQLFNSTVNNKPEPVYTTEIVNICQGGNYMGWTETGTYQRTLTASSGVDSIVTTTLTVNPTYFITDNITINQGEDYLGWTQSGQYLQNLTSAAGCDSIVVTNLTVIQIKTQSIYLNKGWNIFSTYVEPADSCVSSLQNIQTPSNQLIEVQDEIGNTYIKRGNTWVNNIGDLKKTDGYKIRVKSSCVLNISGYPVQLPMNIQLQMGWNIISFPIDRSVDAMEFINPLIESGILVKVQDEKGNSIEYWGSTTGWLNGIGNFEPGKGYLVQVNKDGVLPVLENYAKNAVTLSERMDPVFFNVNFEGNGSGHMNINIERLDFASLQIGDEIAVFDGEICVGAVKISESNMSLNAISINASVTDEDTKNGFTEGNPITIKIWHSDSNTISYYSTSIIKGEMYFVSHESVFVQLKNQTTRTDIVEIESANFNIYPNPATDNVTIDFNQLPKSGTKLIFTDLAGKKLLTREVQSTNETFDIQMYPPGVYLINIVSGNQNSVKKLIKN